MRFKSKKVSRNSAASAFALVEALVSAALVAIITVSAIGGMTVMNRIAMTNRLLTLASNVARDQVDYLQTAGPFNPQLNQIPSALALGTQTTIPYGYPTTSSPNFPLYSDSGKPVVLGTMTTTVASTGTLNTYTGKVEVQFQYCNRTYSVTRNMIRSAD